MRRVHPFLLTELVGKGAVLGLLVLVGVLRIWEVLALLIYSPLYVQDLSYAGVPFAGHALRAEFGEGNVFVILSGVHQVNWEVCQFFDGCQ